MLNLVFLLAFGLVQAAPDASMPVEKPYHVGDPFDIEEEDAALVGRAPIAASAEASTPSPERIICRSRSELGARTRRVRVCMTAAQWQLHAANMEQQRRDINDWGMNGMGR